jgi:hypothetical protein
MSRLSSPPHGATISAHPPKSWREQEKNLFDAALARVKQRADPKHLQIFDCYVMKGWTVEDIARSLKVSPALIYTTKTRISTLIKEEVKRLEKEML